MWWWIPSQIRLKTSLELYLFFIEHNSLMDLIIFCFKGFGRDEGLRFLEFTPFPRDKSWDIATKINLDSRIMSD